MGSDKKLGIWGKDKIVHEDGKLYASDYYCVRCYQDKKEVPAEKFFPIIDIDIPSFPHCKKYIEELTIQYFLRVNDADKKIKK